MSRRNATLVDQLGREAGRNREARVSTIRGARGARTELTDPECGDTLTATGLVTVGPGESVTTIRPRDNFGRPLRNTAQALPDQGVGTGGFAAFQGTRRSADVDVPVLSAADPEELIPGETTPTVFFGTGLRESPLDVISAVLEGEPATPDPRVTVENLAWVVDPEAAGGGPGQLAITGDVTLDLSTTEGSQIFYNVART
jgi:hypothetical protein